MADERRMTLYFTDGSKMVLNFPKRVKSDCDIGISTQDTGGLDAGQARCAWQTACEIRNKQALSR